MNVLTGWGWRGGRTNNDTKGPWGSTPDGSDNGTPPGGPWGGGDPARPRAAPTFEDLLERSRRKFGVGGGGGGGGSFRPDRSLVKWGVIGILSLWLLSTTAHRIAPEERGVVTQFGRYSGTLVPGFSFTLPAPIARVQKVDVENIRSLELGSEAGENLMLTGDKNILDIAYQVRWKISSPEDFLFELAEPEGTIREVAESAMRQVVAQVTLQDAMGNKRGEIEGLVQQEMQAVLDHYKSGVQIQGIAIKQADPPAAVNDAFKEVTAAQQDAQTYKNSANAYALQLLQQAQGEATAFDKVYEQYRLAPDVTRRRMYYETMERVLQGVDKTIVGPGTQSYLPLPELRRAPAQGGGQ